MEIYNGDTSILSISSKKINSCHDVAEKLKEFGILSQVKSNETIMVENGKYYIEKGCNILLPGLNRKFIGEKVWEPLKEEFELDCAHLKVNDKFNGCIYDFLRPSNCPPKKFN